MSTLTTNTLSDLRPGDRVVSVAGGTYGPDWVVTAPLAPLEPGHPVQGVRCGTMAGGVERVVYPDPAGRQIVFERP